MSSRRAIRKGLLRGLWLAIGLVVAVSLAKLAFTGADTGAKDALTPTGTAPASEVVVEQGSVDNSLKVDGTIVIDPPDPTTAPADGKLIYVFAQSGTHVEEGDRLFQVRTETEPAEPAAPAEGAPPAAPAKPVVKYLNVYAPVEGIVGSYSLEVGDDVTKKATVVSVRRQTFKAVGAINPLDRYRLQNHDGTARVEIKGGPAPFTCTGLAVGDTASTPVASGESANPEGAPPGAEGPGGGGEGSSGAKITCRVPPDVKVFDGLKQTMTIDGGKAKNALVVPVTAVRGLVSAGTVWILGKDGIEEQRAVRLGLTDGKIVEVRSGLKAGDRVLRYVPGSNQGQQGPEEQMG